MSKSKSLELIEQYKKEKPYYEIFCDKIDYLLKELIKAEGIKFHSITNRVKDEDSFEKKLESKKNKYTNLSDITDLSGNRIVTYYTDDVDLVAKLIEREFIVDKENTIDKGKSLDPDKFGYVSLHYVVQIDSKRSKWPEYTKYADYKTEIQIRTILQHAWADIEHDLGYKSKYDIPEHIEHDFSRLAATLEGVDKEFLSIKEKLAIHRESEDKQIEEENDISIDGATLKTFMEINEKYNKLNNEIFKFANLKPLESSEQQIDNCSELLWSIKFNKIIDIRNALDKEYDFILYIAKNRLKNRSTYSITYKTELEPLTTIVGIFYLCMTIACQKYAMNEQPCSFIGNHSNIIQDTSDDGGISKRTLVALYEKYQQ